MGSKRVLFSDELYFKHIMNYDVELSTAELLIKIGKIIRIYTSIEAKGEKLLIVVSC